MSVHIGATQGQIAPVVLLPGDPLRAKWIAERFFTGTVQYTTVRNMLGFTGTAKLPDGGHALVSVQGAGMGMPSLAIYVNELFDQYGVETIIRVGTCGGYREDMKPGDIVIAQGSCSDSNLNRLRFNGLDYAPLADWELLHRAFHAAQQLGIPVRVGNILSSDTFYNRRNRDGWKMWADAGVIAVEMETAELYTLAAERNKKALTILTVSDVLPTGEQMNAQQRETCANQMVRIALRAAYAANGR